MMTKMSTFNTLVDSKNMKTERSLHISIKLVAYAHNACHFINSEFELTIRVVMVNKIPKITPATTELPNKERSQRVQTSAKDEHTIHLLVKAFLFHFYISHD